MTNRDPYNPEFIRKNEDFINCLKNYYSFSDETKLKSDLKRPDIDLVCYYELSELRKHIRDNNNSLHFIDFVKLRNIVEEEKFIKKFA